MTCPACDLGGFVTYGEHRTDSPECQYHEPPPCNVKGCRRRQSHLQVFNRGGVLLELRVCERHAVGPIPFPNGDLDRPIHSERIPAA